MSNDPKGPGYASSGNVYAGYGGGSNSPAPTQRKKGTSGTRKVEKKGDVAELQR